MANDVGSWDPMGWQIQDPIWHLANTARSRDWGSDSVPVCRAGGAAGAEALLATLAASSGARWRLQDRFEVQAGTAYAARDCVAVDGVDTQSHGEPVRRRRPLCHLHSFCFMSRPAPFISLGAGWFVLCVLGESLRCSAHPSASLMAPLELVI